MCIYNDNIFNAGDKRESTCEKCNCIQTHRIERVRFNTKEQVTYICDVCGFTKVFIGDICRGFL